MEISSSNEDRKIEEVLCQLDGYRETIQRYCRETAVMSFTVVNDDYKRLVQLGNAIVPDLLKDLEEENSSLTHAHFSLLHEITQVCPFRVPKDSGRYKQMRQAWIKWGKENGYL